MKLSDLISRVRSYTRDTTGTLFSTSDVKAFINEGVDKFRQIKQLEGMNYLDKEFNCSIIIFCFSLIARKYILNISSFTLSPFQKK